MKLLGNFVIPFLIGIIATGLDPAPANAQRGSQSPTPDPQSLLERAIVRLEGCNSISAKTRQRVELFGKSVVGSGSYLELRTTESLMFRLELKFQLADRGATLLQVCNGPHLWIYRDLGSQDSGDKPSVDEVDVARIARELEEKGQLPKMGMVGDWPGLGGLPKLLRGLYLAFDFTTAEAALAEDRLPVVRLQGQWKPAKLAQLLPEQAAQINAGGAADLGKLPPHVPHYVVLDLEQGGLFPRRIEYWRRLPASPRSPTPPENRLLTSIDFLDVQINVPVDPSRFQFDPTGLSVSHQTDQYLEMMKAK